MNSELQKELSQLAYKFLALDKIEKDAKTKKEKLKNDINIICDSSINHFVDGQFELPEAGAVIKIAMNPPKVLDSRTDKGMDPAERQKIAMILADQYCTVDINVKEILLSIESDKKLRLQLEENHVAIQQYSRYDIKKIKS